MFVYLWVPEKKNKFACFFLNDSIIVFSFLSRHYHNTVLLISTRLILPFPVLKVLRAYELIRANLRSWSLSLDVFSFVFHYRR